LALGFFVCSRLLPPIHTSHRLISDGQLPGALTMNLSVCLLTRDDEARLPRLLESVAGVADEVIVADTGSADGTAALARKSGARVLNVVWDDDFAEGRNQALAAAGGDWILWLNPDDELDSASRPALASCLGQAEALAWFVRVWEFPRSDLASHTETVQPRLFRNRRDARFRGRLHPYFDPPLEELAQRHALKLGAAAVCIRHHAYLSTLTEDKLRWAARLLERELRDRPGQLHYLIEYGRTLLILKDARGHEVLAEAATQVLQSAAAPAPPTPTVGELLEYVFTAPEGATNPLSYELAKELTWRWFPATPPVLWALASAEFRAGRFSEAIPILERLIQIGATGHYDRAASFEPSILGGLAWQNLGICYTRLSDWDRAEYCFGRLLALPGFQDQGRRHYTWVQQQRRKS
jgi:Glycosyl transferase family 2/Tetratricopeptide repeat